MKKYWINVKTTVLLKPLWGKVFRGKFCEERQVLSQGMINIIPKKYIILIKKYHNCDEIKNNFEGLTAIS